MSITTLELDLEVFTGPFDLLLTLVLREEVDLLELQLAEVVLAYLDHLEQRGELDLETATEFIVLIAALLELKSRLMLMGEEEEELEKPDAPASDASSPGTSHCSSIDSGGSSQLPPTISLPRAGSAIFPRPASMATRAAPGSTRRPRRRPRMTARASA